MKLKYLEKGLIYSMIKTTLWETRALWFICRSYILMSVCEFVVYVKPFDDNAKSFHSIRDKNPFNRENTTQRSQRRI